ncbi:MAPEG family protein [Pseudomonas sp. Marseille-Q1929]|nr:MAPEG family protein [Pseudomonas sp. Marseille-Q1929]
MNDLLPVYVACVLVLCLKMFAVSCYQGYFRLRGRAFTNREDAAFFKRSAQPMELPQVARAARAWANDLENIPLFFVLGGLCVAQQSDSAVTLWLFGVFTLARMMHTLAYLMEWQPWRTLAYGVGVACLFGLGARIMENSTDQLWELSSFSEATMAAGLLVKMLPVPPPSQASQLPQLSGFTSQNVGVVEL